MWKTVKLGEICEVVTKGTTPTSVGFKFEDDGINFVKVESINLDGTFIPAKFAKINTECHAALKRSQLHEGDILFSIAGALGRTAIVTKKIIPANTNQALAILRLKLDIEVDKKFLLYVLNSEGVKEQSNTNKGGVAQQNLSLSQLKNYLISLPPLAEQQRIVAKLDAAFAEIDSAVALIVAKEAEVERLKTALLTSLLSDDGANWVAGKLGEICEVVTKGTTPTSVGFKFEDDGINFVKVESINLDGTFIPAKFAKINTECHAALKRSQLHEGDILFSIAGALGRTAIVTKKIIPANTNQALAILRLKLDIEVDKKFLLYVLNSEGVKEQSNTNKGGVAQQNLSLSQLKNYLISLPPLAEQQRIVAKLDSAFAEIQIAKASIVKSKDNYAALKSAILAQELQSEAA
ncbi:MAG: restriction endonuclease subunit S [Candidatus Eutrophobiaceae bacterium]